jgi:hypothetical protein
VADTRGDDSGARFISGTPVALAVFEAAPPAFVSAPSVVRGVVELAPLEASERIEADVRNVTGAANIASEMMRTNRILLFLDGGLGVFNFTEDSFGVLGVKGKRLLSREAAWRRSA